MNAAEPTPGRARRWAVLVVVLAFAAGALAGAGAVHLHHACRTGHGDAASHPLPPPLAALDLTGDQLAKVREVLDRYHPRIQAVMRESWPRLKPVFDEMAVEINVFLTPDQRARFDAERQRMEERRFGQGEPPDSPAPEGRVP